MQHAETPSPDAVIQLESSANLGTAYYKQDEIRRESIEDALAIEQAITTVWSDHPGCIFLKANQSFERKFSELLDALKGIIL